MEYIKDVLGLSESDFREVATTLFNITQENSILKDYKEALKWKI